ncbi:MAG: bifunctional UDP-N-acetylglucosamine diphosphorylase/glucosamine-1-phosphate N-acetyltransferase GlmU [bacterium]
MESIASIILAAGQGKRMKSFLPKALHPVAGSPMVSYSLELTKSLGIGKRIVVIGQHAKIIKKEISDIENEIIYAYQDKQLGTAHAVQQAEKYLVDFSGIILILYTDVPLLKASTIQRMINCHKEDRASCTLLTANLEQPVGYGRIIRNQEGKISEIVEQGDLTKEQNLIKEINAGIYCFNSKELFAALQLVNKNNCQKEYYLTDVIKILLEKGKVATTVTVRDKEEIMGINTRMDLSRVSCILYQRNAYEHMSNGVTIMDKNNTYIDSHVKIGQDTVIYPYTIITAGTEIGKCCHIGPYSHIINSSIGRKTRIHSSNVEKSKIGNNAIVGPYAHIRPESTIGDDVRIGNYVEVKKTFIDKGSKVGHLTYLGDATLGKKVNIGAGTITCNFDGKKKNPTTIKDDVFIGSNNALVAPITIDRNSYTAAGSTITENVPPESLGIARSRQKNIIGWTKKKNKRETK